MQGVTTVLLVRHGRTTANSDGVLAGWTPGVHLDESGQAQVAALAERLRPVPLSAVISSPLERCRETAEALVAGRTGLQVTSDDGVGECHYGQWNGRRLDSLAKERLWHTVQEHPSAVTFPGGEALRDTQHRAVGAVRRWNAQLGDGATYVVCSHGDVLKTVIADALGMHLDAFQRIQVGPASLTVIRYTRLRPFVLRLNDSGGGVDDLVPEPPRTERRWPWRRRRAPRGFRWARRSSDSVVGGGASTA